MPRNDSSGLLHRAAHYLHLRKLADELETQAATWQLLSHLYCMGDQPAAHGAPLLDGVGGKQTARQLIREVINDDEKLARCVSCAS